MTQEHYTTAEIAEMATLSISAVKARIRTLEIFPDYLVGKARFFNQEKTQAIISQIKYRKRTYFLIFESKMNYEN